jgi:hypothetical protein
MQAGTTKAGDSFEKSKTEAMHFPANPNSELSDILPEPFYISALHCIHFTLELCHLGSCHLGW